MKLNAEKIQKELARLGWSQNKLAEEMGVHRQYINKILNSNSYTPNIKTINKIASTLDIDPKDLLKS